MTLRGKTILVTGAAGMLGRDLAPLLEDAGTRPLLTDNRTPGDAGPSISRLDITDQEAVKDIVQHERPDWIVNCAAYTNVDQAETDYQTAFQVNAFGPARLAAALRESGGKLLHISSDYVFGGGRQPDAASRNPWCEDSPLLPCGIYGHSKCFGDQLALGTLAPHAALIVRTSWLHGRYGPNFLDTMLRLAKEQKEIRVVDDQIGSPTWTRWLAETLIKLMQHDASGVYHAASRGDVSWFMYAGEIFRQAGLAAELKPWSSAELNRPAPRPPYSTLAVKKLERLLGTPCPDWKDDIRGHLEELGILKEKQ